MCLPAKIKAGKPQVSGSELSAGSGTMLLIENEAQVIADFG
jgi:hypothetical protein